MTTPPTTQKWVPLWPLTDPTPPIPTPVDGKWLKGAPGGAMTWSDLPVVAPPTGIVTPSSAWQVLGTDVALQSGYVNYAVPYGPGRFRKLASGMVVCEGLITGPTSSIAFYMPVGYRPAPQVDNSNRDHIFVCASGATNVGAEGARVQSVDGRVLITATGSTSWIDLSGIIYWAP